MPKTPSSSSAPVSTSLSVVSSDCAQNDFDSINNSLDDVLTMVESLKTKSSFESTIKNTIQVLIKHMRYYQLIAVLYLVLWIPLKRTSPKRINMLDATL